jgi:hypothetical protein
MAFDSQTRNRLARFVADARELIAEEFTQKFQSLYGLSSTGEITALADLKHLDKAQLATAERLRARLRHLEPEAGDPDRVKPETIEHLAREQAFTVLNRLAAIRMAEKRGIIVESVGRGYESKGFKVYLQLAGNALGDTYHKYRRYLFCLFDELAVDLGALFDRRSPAGLLFLREPALLQLLQLLNAPGVEPLWAEDERSAGFISITMIRQSGRRCANSHQRHATPGSWPFAISFSLPATWSNFSPITRLAAFGLK